MCRYTDESQESEARKLILERAGTRKSKRSTKRSDSFIADPKDPLPKSRRRLLSRALCDYFSSNNVLKLDEEGVYAVPQPALCDHMPVAMQILLCDNALTNEMDRNADLSPNADSVATVLNAMKLSVSVLFQRDLSAPAAAADADSDDSTGSADEDDDASDKRLDDDESDVRL